MLTCSLDIMDTMDTWTHSERLITSEDAAAKPILNLDLGLDLNLC